MCRPGAGRWEAEGRATLHITLLAAQSPGPGPSQQDPQSTSALWHVLQMIHLKKMYTRTHTHTHFKILCYFFFYFASYINCGIGHRVIFMMAFHNNSANSFQILMKNSAVTSQPVFSHGHMAHSGAHTVVLFATCGRQPTRLLCPWDSPGKNTGVRCHALLQGKCVITRISFMFMLLM